MKIKEIEERAKMSRANIRFYESLGLLNPIRDKSGYRDYSDEDLEVLKKIKLFRLLEMPLEDIKALQTGEQNLIDVLEQHLQYLRQQQNSLKHAQELCQQMQHDNVSYQNLNVQYYLDSLTTEPLQETPILETDVLPTVYAPWRRFWARSLDIALYFIIVTLFEILVLDWSIISQIKLMSTVSTIAQIVLFLLIEPILLSIFGTTLGKWIVGLSVTDNYGRKLTYSEAFSRTYRVITSGMALLIPVAFPLCLINNYKKCKNKETLYWENSSMLVLKDEENDDHRLFLYIAVHILLFLLEILAVFYSTLPKHRGDITAEEFCANYNRYMEYYGVYGRTLLPTGRWEALPNYVASELESGEKTHFLFEKENEILKKVTFTMQYIPAPPDKDNHRFQVISSYENEIKFAIYSFVKAQEDYTFFFDDLDDMLKEVENKHTKRQYGWDDFSFTVHGISVQFDVEKDGYSYLKDGVFIDNTLTTNPLTLHLTMTKS